MTTRVIIVGAGPAGVRAAETLVEHGHRPVVIDEGERSGGQIYRRPPAHFGRSYETLYGSEAGRARDLHASFDRLAGRIDYRPQTLAWSVFDGTVHLAHAGTTAAESFDRLILATGAGDRVMPMPGWTLPGVYTMGGAQIALKAQACAIGARPAFVGSGPLLYLVAYQYLRAGTPPVAVLDTSTLKSRLAGLPLLASRPGLLAKGLRTMAALRRAGVTMRTAVRPLLLAGTPATGVTGLRFEAQGRVEDIACDAVGLGYHLRSEAQLADLAGCRFVFDPVARQWLPETDAMGRSSVPSVYLAGDGVRLLGADGAEISGRLAALAMLRDTGTPISSVDVDRLLTERKRVARFAAGIHTTFPWPASQAATLPDETIVCRCESITAGDVRRAAGPLAAPEINRAKAFSRVGMGRCQGRYCGLAGQEIVAAVRASPIEAVGRLRGQTPVKPLPVATTKGCPHG
jgi:NADPH-dependent 2,4-dienoyl-CoA reductase/sulfur reductase-like enzyme